MSTIRFKVNFNPLYFCFLFLGILLLFRFLFDVPPLGWLGVMIIVLFFVRELPHGWLGDIIIVLLSLPSAYIYSSVCMCLMFCEVGFDSPKLVSGDPFV